MSKFTRIDRQATEPKARDSRVFGQKVAVGEPVRLDAGGDLKRQVEHSLEMIAQERLLEAEKKAQARAREIIEAAQAQARETLEKANAQARELVRIARDEEQEIRDTAQETGFKTGFQEGYADATAQVEQETVDLLKSANLLLEAAYQAERRVLQDFETHAMELLRHLTRKIVQRELSDSPETLLGMISRAAESLYLSGKVKVVLHPQVLHEIRQFSENTASTLETLQRFELTPDPGLALEQVYIIGQEHSFDLTPESQLDLLMEPLEAHLELPRSQAEAVDEVPVLPADGNVVVEPSDVDAEDPAEVDGIDLAVKEMAASEAESAEVPAEKPFPDSDDESGALP